MKKPKSFSEAHTRLKQIIDEIENNDIEMDEVTYKIKEAKDLIDFCHAFLKSTQGEIKKLLEN